MVKKMSATRRCYLARAAAMVNELMVLAGD